jgi:hypothetical protein
MSHVYEDAAIRILDWLHHAERDLEGKHVTTVDGKSGIVCELKLDTHHGLRFTFEPHTKRKSRNWYPVSTIKLKER